MDNLKVSVIEYEPVKTERGEMFQLVVKNGMKEQYVIYRYSRREWHYECSFRTEEEAMTMWEILTAK